jgi:hypothetical protein
MRKQLAHLARAVSRWCSRFAEQLEPTPTLAPTPAIASRSDDPEGDFADRLVNDMVLRNSLHAALHRYSPREEPGEA